MVNNHQKNIATFIHLSTFSRFIFPLGNFIGPLILWTVNKDKSEFIDQHGKQALNFQISMLLYAIILGTLTIPFFIFKLFSGLDFIDFNGFHDFHISMGKPSALLYVGGGLACLKSPTKEGLSSESPTPTAGGVTPKYNISSITSNQSNQSKNEQFYNIKGMTL